MPDSETMLMILGALIAVLGAAGFVLGGAKPKRGPGDHVHAPERDRAVADRASRIVIENAGEGTQRVEDAQASGKPGKALAAATAALYGDGDAE